MSEENKSTIEGEQKKIFKEQKEQLLQTIDEIKKLVEGTDNIPAAILLINDGKQSLITGGGHPVIMNEMMKQAYNTIPNFFISTKQSCMEYQFDIDVAETAKKIGAEASKKVEDDRLIVPASPFKKTDA